jgi:hypothetical protein
LASHVAKNIKIVFANMRGMRLNYFYELYFMNCTIDESFGPK